MWDGKKLQKSMKVLTIFGTRPEAIKMAPIIKEMEKQPGFSVVVCVTGQHREMLDQVLSIFNIRIDYDLNIMTGNQSLFDITSRSLEGIGQILNKEMPDVVLVQGDTTTAFIGCLASFYMKIPVGHIEAGLRTYKKYNPFPEEINRRLISQIADIHFAPTETAKKNLMFEGISGNKIFVTGNTVIDALLSVAKKQSSEIHRRKLEKYFLDMGIRLNNNEKILLVTGHRRESFGIGFRNICRALKNIALRHKSVKIIYPVHLNPNVQRPVRRYLSGIKNIYLIEPIPYDTFVYLLKKSCLVLTDSGGIQEEAPSFGIPVLVMRSVTERSEAVKAGFAILAGTKSESIEAVTERFLKNDISLLKKNIRNPYGDGKAAKKVVSILRSSWKGNKG